MLRRHVHIWAYVALLNGDTLDPYLLNASAKQKMDTLVRRLSELNEVILKLKSNECTVHQSRIYFDAILKVYPTL